MILFAFVRSEDTKPYVHDWRPAHMSLMTRALLEARDVSKSFGGVVALDKVSLEVEEGEIVALIGPNGAGKTTFFNIVSGLMRPDQGVLRIGGDEITWLPPHVICRRGVARTFQLVKPFRNASVIQNALIGAIFGNRSKDRNDAWHRSTAALKIVDLDGKKDLPASELTLAELRRLEIARALATDPKVLILDEAMAGLDHSEVESILNLIRQIKNRGVSILMVEHLMHVVMSVAERVIVLNNGQKIAEGKPAEIVRDKAVISAYLGEDYAQNI